MSVQKLCSEVQKVLPTGWMASPTAGLSFSDEYDKDGNWSLCMSREYCGVRLGLEAKRKRNLSVKKMPEAKFLVEMQRVAAKIREDLRNLGYGVRFTNKDKTTLQVEKGDRT